MLLLKIDSKHQELLATIRHWHNLKVAFDEGFIWIKDFTPAQFDDAALQRIPYTTLFEVKDNLLFLKGSLLPQQKMPSGLLWSPILRAFPIELPSLNHNYFGIEEKVSIQLVRSEIEAEAFVLVASIQDATQYITTAPEVRLHNLKWIVLDDEVVLFGTPMLPIEGRTYWRNNDFLLPSGYHFEFPILAETIQEAVNPDGNQWVFWQTDSSYFKISKEDVKPLSISSFRLTFSQ